MGFIIPQPRVPLLERLLLQLIRVIKEHDSIESVVVFFLHIVAGQDFAIGNHIIIEFVNIRICKFRKTEMGNRGQISTVGFII